MKIKSDKSFNDSDIKELIHTLFVTVLLNRSCNLNCSYCDVINNNSYSRNISISDMSRIIDLLDNQVINKRPNLILHMFGGEPTLNKDIEFLITEAIERLSNKYNLDIIMTTNLTAELSLYDSLDCVYTTSFHSERIVDIQDWFNKAYHLNNVNKLHHVVLMVTPDNMELIAELYDEHHKNVPCIIVPIDEIMETQEYNIFKKNIINKYSTNTMFDSDEESELFFDKPVSPNAHVCNSGIIIDEFGELKYCWTRINEKSVNIFNDTSFQIPYFHVCNKYCDNCDMEVVRCSPKYYINNILPALSFGDDLVEYKNSKLWFRCNG